MPFEDERAFEAFLTAWNAAHGTAPVSVQGVSGTNLGATQTIDFQNRVQEIWLVGTLNTNLTVTIVNRVATCKATLILLQDATGGRTLTVSDGVTPQLVPIASSSGAASTVDVDCPDATTVPTVSGANGVSLAGDLSGTLTSPIVTTVRGGKTPMMQAVDSMAWVAHPSNPLFASAAGATGVGGGFGDIWYDGSSTFHYYGHVDGTTPGIYHWTSPSGLPGTWTADAGNPILTPGTTGAWDAGTVGVPCVWSEGTNLFMIYRGTDGSGNVKNGKATASTSNPSVWTKYVSNPVFSGTSPMVGSEAGPGRVIKVGSTYYMWISNISGYNRWCSYATAPDLGSNNGPGTWTQAAVNPVFTGGRFCNSVWTDGAFYYSLVPHYTGFAATAEIELWRSVLPTFPHSNRDYLGVVRRVNTAASWEASQYDTPTVLCDNIFRNSQNCTNGQPWIYYSGQSVPGLFLEGLLQPQTAHSPAPIDHKAVTFCGPWRQDALVASESAVQIPMLGTVVASLTAATTSTSVTAISPPLPPATYLILNGTPGIANGTTLTVAAGGTTGTLSVATTGALSAQSTVLNGPDFYYRNPFSCSVVSLSLTTSANVTAGSVTAKLTNWLGNNAYAFFPSGGLAASVTSGKSQGGVAAEEGDFFFAMGEGFGVQITTAAGLTPATLSVDVTVGVVPR